jgi:ABC-type glycerol-3-phosphate transport system permease component
MMTVTLADLNQEPDYGMVFAGLTLSAVPTVLLFLIFQRRFISGIMSGYLWIGGCPACRA